MINQLSIRVVEEERIKTEGEDLYLGKERKSEW